MNNDTNENGAPPARPKRSPGPVRIGMAALVVAAAFYFWPHIKSMSPDAEDTEKKTNGSAVTEGIPFDAVVSVGELTDSTITYTIKTTYRNELTSLHYDIQLQDDATQKFHDVPSGSCKTSYIDNTSSRTCISPLTNSVVPGKYSLLITLTDADENSLALKQDSIEIL